MKMQYTEPHCAVCGTALGDGDSFRSEEVEGDFCSDECREDAEEMADHLRDHEDYMNDWVSRSKI